MTPKPSCKQWALARQSLKSGETLQSDVNATILARLLALVQATNHPFVLLGDWQNSPGSISSTVLPSKFHFEVLAPDVSLLSGNVIDYALIHTSLASTTSLTTEWAIPWRPHALLSYHFNIEEATKEYRQIQQFPPLPATPDIDFRPWTTYKSTAYELDLYGNPHNDTAQQWADWLSCTGAPLGCSRKGFQPKGMPQTPDTQPYSHYLETRPFGNNYGPGSSWP